MQTSLPNSLLLYPTGMPPCFREVAMRTVAMVVAYADFAGRVMGHTGNPR